METEKNPPEKGARFAGEEVRRRDCRNIMHRISETVSFIFVSVHFRSKKERDTSY